MKNNSIKEYRRIMRSIALSDDAKQRIVKRCAAYSTLNKIKVGKFTVTAVKKEKTTDRV